MVRVLKTQSVQSIGYILQDVLFGGSPETSILYRIGVIIEPVTMFFGLKWQAFQRYCLLTLQRRRDLPLFLPSALICHVSAHLQQLQEKHIPSDGQRRLVFSTPLQHYLSPALYTISDCWYFNVCIIEKVGCLIVCKKTDICYNWS